MSCNKIYLRKLQLMKKLKKPLPVKEHIPDPRTLVLNDSLKLESNASLSFKNLLRLARPDSKRLNNLSCSLSFKNKIDLFYEVGDINKTQYLNFVKFIEIRNVFIQNISCCSFSHLSKEGPKLTKFLSANFKNDISDTEKSLAESFRELFIENLSVLFFLSSIYHDAFLADLDRRFESKTMRNFDSIFNSAYAHWKKYKQSQAPTALSESFNNLDKEIQNFEKYLKYHFLDEKIKLLEKLTKGNSAQKDMNLKRTELLKKYTSEKKEVKVINK